MTAEITPDPELIRRRTVYGWSTFESTQKGRNRVIDYLTSGDPRPLEGTRYAEERMAVIRRLTKEERKQLGLGAKQREPKPKLHKPSPEELALFDQAMKDDVSNVKVFDGTKAKLMVVFGEDGELTLSMNCDPVEAAALLHSLSHLILAAEERKPES
ncbi:hypothetical protein SEA_DANIELLEIGNACE_64 [Arthrobacter phage DanielleIgnace]|nr:hypothetical protein SEA_DANIELLEIGNACE_64 [Arthrobacter phage DanielleIgnace]